MSGILVAGIGNVFFGDDAFGVEVARRLLAGPLPDGVRVGDYGIRGVHRSRSSRATKSLGTTTLRIEGSVALDMRDFDITPPNCVDRMFEVNVRVVVERERA